jgi:hypothetical protein
LRDSSCNRPDIAASRRGHHPTSMLPAGANCLQHAAISASAMLPPLKHDTSRATFMADRPFPKTPC